jgi:hypothetical protein
VLRRHLQLPVPETGRGEPERQGGLSSVGEPTAARDAQQGARRRLERLAWLLDSSLPIPRSNYRIGLEALVGLLPGIGDAIGAALGVYVLAEAARLSAPRSVLLRMAGNTALDALIGMIPLAGDLFDVAWRANTRNVRLLGRYLDAPQATARGSRVGIGVVLIAAAIGVIATAVIGVAVLRWAINLL